MEIKMIRLSQHAALLLGVISLLLVGTLAHAQTDSDTTSSDTESSAEPESPEVIARARSMYAAGEAAFSEGHFEEAVQLFSHAYELSARPVLLYNIGMAHDRAGHDTDAVRFYEDYLVQVPGSDNAAYVRSRVAVLRQRAAADTAENDARENSADAQDTNVHGDIDAGTTRSDIDDATMSSPTPIVPIILFSVAGASAIVGTVLAITAVGIRNDLDTRCPDQRCTDADRGDVARMGHFALASDILFGVAIAGAVTGVVLLLTGTKSDTPPPVSASCSTEACAMTVQGSF